MHVETFVKNKNGIDDYCKLLRLWSRVLKPGSKCQLLSFLVVCVSWAQSLYFSELQWAFE